MVWDFIQWQLHFFRKITPPKYSPSTVVNATTLTLIPSLKNPSVTGCHSFNNPWSTRLTLDTVHHTENPHNPCHLPFTQDGSFETLPPLAAAVTHWGLPFNILTGPGIFETGYFFCTTSKHAIFFAEHFFLSGHFFYHGIQYIQPTNYNGVEPNNKYFSGTIFLL